MYMGIDIGGTKTLVATLSDDGVIQDQRQFPTDHDYDKFLRNLGDNLHQLQPEKSGALLHCCAGVPGLLDREHGIVRSLGNLPWRDKPIRDDISHLLDGAPVTIENDARLAGLSEAQLVRGRYQRVLFLTISTGIGGALIQDGRLVTTLQDTEMGKMPLLHGDEYVHWEDFAGGRSVVADFHEKAAEITDPSEWQTIAHNLAQGLAPLCSILQPEAIILGGSVGKYADRYSPAIMEFLAQHLHPVVRQPQAILAAQRPDQAVIFGCYDFANQAGSHAQG